MSAGLPGGTVLGGELYPGTAGRERIGDVARALAEGGEGLAFGAFHIVRLESDAWRDNTYATRLELLRNAVASEGSVHVIPFTTVEAEADVIGLNQGLDGMTRRAEA